MSHGKRVNVAKTKSPGVNQFKKSEKCRTILEFVFRKM